jgi:hypothetical protein
VLVFSSAGAWEPAAEPLHRLWESFTPVHQELMRPGLPAADQGLSDAELARRAARERVTGAGLGLAFGIAMAQSSGRRIGLVAAAHGGTSLEQWSPALKDRGGHSLYGAMLERIARAGGRLRGVLWYQGESDAHDVEAGRSYAERFDRWIAALRSDTGRPDLPVIAVQIGRVIPADEGQKAFPARWTCPSRTPSTSAPQASSAWAAAWGAWPSGSRRSLPSLQGRLSPASNHRPPPAAPMPCASGSAA